MLPARADAGVVVICHGARGDGLRHADLQRLRLAPNLRIEHESVDVRQLPVNLAEVQVLVERQRRRPELRGDIGRQQARDVRPACARRHGDRSVEALAFIGHEEVQHVLDDRAAERDAELLVLRIDLPARVELRGRASAEIGGGIRAHDLALEAIGTGACFRGHRGARDLVVFGLVVGRDDLVLADRKLWERVALAEELATHAALADIVFLPDTVDEHVDRADALRAAAQCGVAARIDAEREPRHRIRELEKVTGDLRHRLDLHLRDRGGDLRGPHFRQPRSAHRHRGNGATDLGRLAQVERGSRGHAEGRRDFGTFAGFHSISARRKTYEAVDAISSGRGPASEAGGDIAHHDLGIRRSAATQSGQSGLSPPRCRQNQQPNRKYCGNSLPHGIRPHAHVFPSGDRSSVPRPKHAGEQEPGLEGPALRHRKLERSAVL